MKSKMLSLLAPVATSALFFPALAAPVHGEIPCPQSFISLLEREVYGPKGSLTKLTGGMVNGFGSLQNCTLHIVSSESGEVISIDVLNVNPVISYSTKFLGLFPCRGSTAFNAEVRADYDKQNGICTNTHCDFSRTGGSTEGNFIATELFHFKCNKKVASRIDVPFQEAFTTYLENSDFWPTVLEFAEQSAHSSH